MSFAPLQLWLKIYLPFGLLRTLKFADEPTDNEEPQRVKEVGSSSTTSSIIDKLENLNHTHKNTRQPFSQIDAIIKDLEFTTTKIQESVSEGCLAWWVKSGYSQYPTLNELIETIICTPLTQNCC